MRHDAFVAVNENVWRVEERLAAVEAWIAAQKQAFAIGDLTWATAWADVRRIAVNYILRNAGAVVSGCVPRCPGAASYH
jgi:hypothetical protein